MDRLLVKVEQRLGEQEISVNIDKKARDYLAEQGFSTEYGARPLRRLIQKEIEIQTAEGEWFSMRLLPYRTIENVIDGVVITFVDVNKIKKAEEELKKANEMIKALYEEHEKKGKGLKKL